MSQEAIGLLNRRSTPLEIVKACDGYYTCPKSRSGKRTGPLVGYAGTYEPGKQFVGEEFVNFAKVERFPRLVDELIVPPLLEVLNDRIPGTKVFEAAPMGGIVLATLLGRTNNSEFGYPDSVELSPATETARAVKGLKYGRHEVAQGAQVIITEDVCNNFSTTGQFIDLLLSQGADVRAIVCFLNRSMTVDEFFVHHNGTAYPVITLWRQAIPEYRQDDPFVADDVAAGKVFWKPKDRWDELPKAA